MTNGSVHLLFQDTAQRDPGAIAISEGQTTTTYGTLNERSNGIAALLGEHGVRPGTVVGMWFRPCAGYVAAMLGAMKCGAAFLPLDPATPDRRLESILATAEPALIVTGPAAADELSGALSRASTDLPAVSIDAAAPRETVSCPDPGPGSPCYLMFTSGSTGTPKAVAGVHGGLCHFIQWEIAEFGLGTDCRVSLLAAPTFDVSLRDILAPLLSGGTLCIPDDLRSGVHLDWVQAQGITHMHCVPSVFRLFIHELREGEMALPALRRILLAGEPLYARDVEAWREKMGYETELVNLYGPTETTLAKAFYRIAEIPVTENGMIPLGRPIPDGSLLVIRDGTLCGAGEIGEIYVRTPHRSLGYYGDPVLTAERFIPNPLSGDPEDVVYRTGDLGRYGADDVVEFVGRLDNQVKINGIRVELGEVEHNLRRHPDITEAAAAAHPNAEGGLTLAAYFTSEQDLSADSVRRHLAGYMSVNTLPGHIVRLDSLPLNLHGKVDRKALPKPEDMLYADSGCSAPEGEIEEKLAVLWSQVLGIERVGVDRAFLDLGGDSLKAIRLVGQVFKNFGVELELGVLFEDATIRSVARQLVEDANQ